MAFLYVAKIEVRYTKLCLKSNKKSVRMEKLYPNTGEYEPR